MYCKKCGNILEENAKFCVSCGAKVEEEPQATFLADNETTVMPEDTQITNVCVNSGQTTGVPHEKLTKKAFYDRFASKKTKSWVTTMIVICFVTAGVGVIWLFLGNYLSLLDIAFYAAMGALLLTTRNWIFTLIPTIYSGIFSLINLADGGNMSGVFAIFAGIMSTIALSKVNKAFKEYQNNGVRPDSEI